MSVRAQKLVLLLYYSSSDASLKHPQHRAEPFAITPLPTPTTQHSSSNTTAICSVWHDYAATTAQNENSVNVSDSREQANAAQQRKQHQQGSTASSMVNSLVSIAGTLSRKIHKLFLFRKKRQTLFFSVSFWLIV